MKMSDEELETFFKKRRCPLCEMPEGMCGNVFNEKWGWYWRVSHTFPRTSYSTSTILTDFEKQICDNLSPRKWKENE